MPKRSMDYTMLSTKKGTDHAPCNTRPTCTHKKHGYRGPRSRSKWPRKWLVAGKVVAL